MQSGAQGCVPPVEPRYRPGRSAAAPFIAEFLQTNNEPDPPMLVWVKKPGESPRLRQIHKDHTAYCSGEV